MIKFLGITILVYLTFDLYKFFRDFRKSVTSFDVSREFRDSLILDNEVVREKISKFRDTVSAGGAIQVCLSDTEINCLAIRERAVAERLNNDEVRDLGMYLKYTISESSIFETHAYRFRLPLIISEKFKIFEYKIEYVLDDDVDSSDNYCWLEQRTLLRINKDFISARNQWQDFYDEFSPLIERLLSSRGFYDTSEPELESLVKQIKDIRIVDNLLILES